MNVYKTYKHHRLDEVFDGVLRGKAVFLENAEFLNFHIATQFTHRGVSSVRLMKVFTLVSFLCTNLSVMANGYYFVHYHQ